MKNLKDLAADKGVDSLKSAAAKGAEGVGHAKGFFAEVKDGFLADLSSVASKVGGKK